MMRTLFYLPLLVIIACTHRPESDTTPKSVSAQWQYLTLQLNDTIIEVTKTTDTMDISTIAQQIQKYEPLF